MADVAGNLSTTAEDTIAQWRIELLDKFLIYFLGAMIGVTPFLLYENGIIGDGSSSVLFLVATGICYIAIRIDSNRHLLRCALFGFALQLGSAIGLLQGGFWAPEAVIGLGFTACAIAVILGRNFAWLSLAISALILLGFAAYYTLGFEPKNIDNRDLGRSLNWARIIVIFLGTAAVTVTAIAHQANKLESGVVQRNALILQIETQNQQKLDTMATQQNLEQRLQEARKLEALGQLAGGVAHDFNNLLVIIINTASILQEDATGDNLDDLRQIEEAGERAADLAKQLLRFGQKRTEVVAPFVFRKVLDDTIRLLQRVLPSNIHLDLKLIDDESWIIGSENEIGQVFMNLFLNSRDAMPDGGTIFVSTQSIAGSASQPPFLQFTIRDTGRGMPAEVKARIFEPFYTTKAVNKGTGLGLSVVHGVVEQHKGSISVESEEGKGTIFRVQFPLSEESQQDARNNGASHLPTSEVTPKTIMVVDDSPEIIAIIEAMLKRRGHSVISKSNGVDALRAFEEHQDDIDLVITDAIMPQMGGREFYEAASNISAEQPFLFCSGYDSGTLPSEFFEHPKRSLLMKPFREAELIQKIAELLR